MTSTLTCPAVYLQNFETYSTIASCSDDSKQATATVRSCEGLLALPDGFGAAPVCYVVADVSSPRPLTDLQVQGNLVTDHELC